jgi:hypothetical protein
MLRRSRMLKRPNDNTKSDDEPTTYHALAQAGIALEEGGGRFAAQQAVVGSTADAGSLYPAASVPNADVGEELPVGDDQRPEPVGTPSEVEASLREAETK